MLDSKELEKALTIINPTPLTNEESKRIKVKRRNAEINKSVECQDEINEIANKIRNDSKSYKVDDFPIELSFTTNEMNLDTLKIDKDFFIVTIKNHIFLYPKEFKRYFYKKAENICSKNLNKDIKKYWEKAYIWSLFFQIFLLILGIKIKDYVGNPMIAFDIYWALYSINYGIVYSRPKNVSGKFRWYFLPFIGLFIFLESNILFCSEKIKRCEEKPEILIKVPESFEYITTFFTKNGLRIFICR